MSVRMREETHQLQMCAVRSSSTGSTVWKKALRHSAAWVGVGFEQFIRRGAPCTQRVRLLAQQLVVLMCSSTLQGRARARDRPWVGCLTKSRRRRGSRQGGGRCRGLRARRPPPHPVLHRRCRRTTANKSTARAHTGHGITHTHTHTRARGAWSAAERTGRPKGPREGGWCAGPDRGHRAGPRPCARASARVCAHPTGWAGACSAQTLPPARWLWTTERRRHGRMVCGAAGPARASVSAAPRRRAPLTSRAQRQAAKGRPGV